MTIVRRPGNVMLAPLWTAVRQKETDCDAEMQDTTQLAFPLLRS